jgi:hypothetical protein
MSGRCWVILRDTKATRTGTIVLLMMLKMLVRRKPADAQKNHLTFPDKNSNKVVQISDTFNRETDERETNNPLS